MFVRGIIVEVTVTDGVAGAWKRGVATRFGQRMRADHVPRAWGVPCGPFFLLPSLFKLH